jgi:hypothetical protein
MSNEQTRLAQTRSHASLIHAITEFLVPLLVAAIALPLIGELYLVSFEPAPWAAELGAPRAAAIKLLSYAPAVAGAMAVIMLRPIFAEFHQGRFVSPRASAAYQLAGLWALAALLLETLVTPLGVSLLGGATFNWRFDPLDIALMAFAAAVMMIGQVLEAAAAALKAENEQIV